MKKTKILFFTGAGISAESGLKTFRDSKDGLWDNYKIEDVCTPEAWIKNPKMVLDFYNQRRKECQKAEPNNAHKLIAALENNYEVVVVTQNVDDLHERAGSTAVIHLHGELMKARSTAHDKVIYDCKDDLLLGTVCEKNSQLRPHIIWFGEELDDSLLYKAKKEAVSCTLCVIIGSSLQVYPANSLPHYVSYESQMVIIDPATDDIEFDDERSIHFINKKAVEGMEMLFDSLNRL